MKAPLALVTAVTLTELPRSSVPVRVSVTPPTPASPMSWAPLSLPSLKTVPETEPVATNPASRLWLLNPGPPVVSLMTATPPERKTFEPDIPAGSALGIDTTLPKRGPPAAQSAALSNRTW